MSMELSSDVVALADAIRRSPIGDPDSPTGALPDAIEGPQRLQEMRQQQQQQRSEPLGQIALSDIEAHTFFTDHCEAAGVGFAD